MEYWNTQILKEAVRARLTEQRGGWSPRKLILIHTGIAAGVTLAVMLLSLALSMRIENTGGLGGLGTRTLLTTVQTLLQFAQTVLMPFWSLSYLYTAMKLARRQRVEGPDLLEGFRRFFPYLRLMLLMGLLYLGIVLVCSFVASRIFILTPWARPVLEAMEPMASGTAVDEEAVLDAGVAALTPLLPILMAILGGLSLAVILPVSYQFRLAEYALLDAPEKGARAAMRRSRQLIYRQAWKLFRLDLHFWWYWLLELLVVAVSYGDQILAALGVALSMPPEAAYLLFSGLGLLAQLALFYLAKNRIAVSYALVYDGLIPPPNAYSEVNRHENRF